MLMQSPTVLHNAPRALLRPAGSSFLHHRSGTRSSVRKLIHRRTLLHHMEEIWRKATTASRTVPPTRPQSALVGGSRACDAACAALSIPCAPPSPLPVRCVSDPPLLIAPSESVAAALAPDAAVLLLAFDVARGGGGSVTRGPLAGSADVRVVLVGVVEGEDQKEAVAAQICVRRAALREFGGCAVCLLAGVAGNVGGASPDGEDEDKGAGDSAASAEANAASGQKPSLNAAETVPPSLRALLEDRKLDSKQVALQGDGTFFAQAGWDTPAKIQALVDASKVTEPPELTIQSEETLQIEGSEPVENGDAGDDDDEDRLSFVPEDDEESGDEEEAEWLAKHVELATEPATAVTAPRARAGTAGAGSSFFQRMRSSDAKR